ncbi:MAG: hypothetical protein IJ131_05595, partial [Eggerthellaceae bacterium]|nr:hypothetical protein [Eggerthellaceae bacterium]
MNGNGMKRTAISLACALVLCTGILAGCSANTASSSNMVENSTTSEAGTSQVALSDCPVMRDTSFGGVYVDITIEEFNRL